MARIKVLVSNKELGTWWQGQLVQWVTGGLEGTVGVHRGGWGVEVLTTAEQSLVHEPDVGEALFTRLRDAYLVAGKHMPVVLLDLGAMQEGAKWRGWMPPHGAAHHGCRLRHLRYGGCHS